MRRSWRQRCQWLLPAILFLATVACESPPPPEAEALTEGVWWGTQPEGSRYDQHAYEFTLGDDGLQGVLHFFSAGKKVSEIPIHNVRFQPPTIAFTAGLVPLEGRVDLEGGTMEVESVNRRGPKLKGDAERRDPATIPGLAVWRSAAGETTYRYRQPPETDDGWSTATPEDVGLERATLLAMVEDIIAGEAGLLHSFLVIQDDRLVLEEYFHGFGQADLHRIASCTKSVASLLVGLAIDRGEIASVDVPVLKFFPEDASAAAPGWSGVRLRHLLSMTAGLGWTEEEANRGAGGTGPEHFRRLLSREVAHEPGTRWIYAGGDVNLLSGVLRQATGMHADAYAAAHLFAPLGITDFDWSTWGKKEGYPNLSGSLLLRPRDMAKLGALVLGEGRWHEQQVISAEWIQVSTRPQADTGDEDEGYGYLWRLMMQSGESVAVARGWGSQFILVDPARRTVVVTTGGNDTNGRTFDVLRVVAQHLLHFQAYAHPVPRSAPYHRSPCCV